MHVVPLRFLKRYDDLIIPYNRRQFDCLLNYNKSKGSIFKKSEVGIIVIIFYDLMIIGIG